MHENTSLLFCFVLLYLVEKENKDRGLGRVLRDEQVPVVGRDYVV